MNALMIRQKQICGLTTHHRAFRHTSTGRLWSFKTKKNNTTENPSKYSYRQNNKNVTAVSQFLLTPNFSTNIGAFSSYANPVVVSSNVNFGAVRHFSLSSQLYEQNSSKLEAGVKKIKEKEQEQLLEQQKQQTTGIVATPEKIVVKKTIKEKIWDEVLHYYHGFRLLFIDINVSRKLLGRVLNGKTLTRREHRLMIRTTSDLFRLLPFSVFIIIPFMELLLPVAIKLFPGMLPSTFQSAKDQEAKNKQNLKVKIEMAKFLQKTLDDMSVQSREHNSEAAKDFTVFFEKIRTSGSQATHDEILKFSKLFEDEITLDSLNRQQLTALCRVIEVGTIGTNNLLRFQLRMKLRSLVADDRMIHKEGIESLTLSELQSASRARGMRAFGISEERLKIQLTEWINLSLDQKVPPSLLLLSRAMMLPEHAPTSDKLKATISSLSETVVTPTKAAIGEREGKIDNKTKIEIIRAEEQRIKEEREEQKISEREKAELLADKAPDVTIDAASTILEVATKPIETIHKVAGEISAKDLEVLGDALNSMSKDSNTLMVEKEELKDLKEEIADYQEDVQELQEVVVSAPDKVKESVAAKRLFKKVNSLINKLEKELEGQEQKLKKVIEEKPDIPAIEKVEVEQLVHIDELMSVIRQIQKVPDDSRLEQIYKMLGKIDADQDGHIRVEDVLEVIETISKENVNVSAKQLDELIELMAKEEILETQEKIEKALAKEQEIKDRAELLVDKVEMLKDKAKEIRETIADCDSTNAGSTIDSTVLKEAISKQAEKILPTEDKGTIPPVIPPESPKKSNDKML